MRDQRLALLWHLVEFLLALSIVGVVWSVRHQRPMVECKRPAR